MTPDLQAAIDEFRPGAVADGYDTEEGAYNGCAVASDEFLHTLEAHGIEGATVEHFESTIYLDCQDYPVDLIFGWHWAVRVGDLVVDWTARQFDPEADFPLIWECPRRVWRNCSDPNYEEYNDQRTTDAEPTDAHG